MLMTILSNDVLNTFFNCQFNKLQLRYFEFDFTKQFNMEISFTGNIVFLQKIIGLTAV